MAGEQPKLPYFQNNEEQEESFDTPDSEDLQDFDMPTGTTGSGNLHGDMDMFNERFFQEAPGIDKDAPYSSYLDDSMNSLEADMVELKSLTTFVPPAPAPGAGAGTSFSNSVSDFEAFENINNIHESFLGVDQREEPFSSSSSQNPPKRPLPEDGEQSEAKYRRLTKDELATQPPQSQFPAWVKDADPALINSLKDYVDFVD